jgi:hypothetical protein
MSSTQDYEMNSVGFASQDLVDKALSLMLADDKGLFTSYLCDENLPTG